jgi:steroid delta-isomerase-like uncharacterized protein
MNQSKVLRLAVAGFASLVLVGSLTSQARADQSAVARAWVAAWNSHNPDAVAAVFTRDALYEDLPFNVVNHGTAEIRAFAQFFFTAVPDLRVDHVTIHVRGGHGTIEWVFSGTDRGVFGTGKRFAVRGVTVIDVRGDKISRNSDYYDLATILRQLGLLNNPGGLATRQAAAQGRFGRPALPPRPGMPVRKR